MFVEGDNPNVIEDAGWIYSVVFSLLLIIFSVDTLGR